LTDGDEFGKDISEILFNLSSADRLTLLSSINSQKQRLTNLSKVINASAQECSRHLTRLTESGFIKKDSEGQFETTSFGRIILGLFPTMQFVLKYRDYFLSHDLSFLPTGYTQRIGELSSGEYSNHLSLVLEQIKKAITTGRESVWLISDRPIVIGGSVGTAFSSKSVPVRLIGDQLVDRKIVAELKSVMPQSEVATLPEVRIAMGINEHFAGACFPGLDGKIDFSAGFSGNDPQLRRWCTDLFEYYWAKSSKTH